MANIYATIDAAAKRHGVPTEALLAIAQIESGLNPGADNPNSSASGLFQFTSRTAREYGLTGDKRNDISAQADAAARMAARNASALGRALGRSPTAGELYLAHQQGLGGATALLRNPNLPASQVLSQFYGGNAANVIKQNGGNPNMTAGQFAGMWVNKGNSVAGRIPPGEMPQVATALDVINRVAPTPATPSSAMGYARANTPAVSAPPVPMPRMDRPPSSNGRLDYSQKPGGVGIAPTFQGVRGFAEGRYSNVFRDDFGVGSNSTQPSRRAPVPATPSLPLQSIRAANSANRPELQAALQSYAGRSSPPTPATPSWQTNSIRSGRVPLGNSISNRQTPVGLMDLASSPNAATPRLQSDGSVRSPMNQAPIPADVFDRTTARNNQFAQSMPPVPRPPPPRTNRFEGSTLIADSFNALPTPDPALQAALNNRAGLGSMPSMSDMAAFAGASVPDRLTAGIDQVAPHSIQSTQTAQMPPLPQPRPQTGIGGPLPPIAPPMPPTVQPVAPVAPPVPQPRLQRPGIFGKPMIGNWEVPLPGIFGGIQNFTAAMNNASGPFNNGFDNLLSNKMRGGNFLAPGAAVGQAGGFLYARNPGGGFTNVGRVDNGLTPAQRYDQANNRRPAPTNAYDRMREGSRRHDSDTPQSLVG